MVSEMPTTDGRQAAEALNSASSVLVVSHVNPDGDALGSLLGATLGLRKLGKEVTATWDGAPDLPHGYGFLPGLDAITPPGDLPDADLLLALDCGAPDRLGGLGDLLKSYQRVVNIDHHPGNPGFGTVNHVVTTASSTAELVAGVLRDLGVELDRDIATCLYTGIFTDTGSFQYTNTSPATLRLAADLLEYDVPKTKIAQEVFETSPFPYLKLVAVVLGRAELRSDAGFIYSSVTRADLEASGVGMEATDKVIDLLRSTRDADVAALFKEQEDGRFRVSMRSKGRVNVGDIARSFGGGGHDLASGCTVDAIAPTIEAILAQLPDPDGS
jgi:phosphoesterase RecJ-like protein